MIDVARGGDDHVAAAVPAPRVGEDVLRRERADGLLRAQHRASDRVIGEERRCEQVVDLVVRGVLRAGDLLEDDLAL
jgi:hypothetical protein